MKIPMSSPHITSDEVEAIGRVLQTPYLSMGPCVDEFEGQFTRYIGTNHAAAVSSGTSGLHLCVIAADVFDGDLVLTTPFSFVSSANVILYERAIPVFVDIDPNTLNIDPARVEEAVGDICEHRESADRWLPRNLRGHGYTQTGDKLKAILPIHAFGQPADMDPIIHVAREHGLQVIEDACEAIGAEYKGRKVGTQSDAAVFAFYPNKQMTTGEGGMIATNSGSWDAAVRSLRNQGRDVFDAWLTHTRLGYNYRLDEMSAALGLAQLKRLEELLSKRQGVVQWYNQRLSDMDAVAVPYIAPTTTRMSWFVYVIRLAPELDRDAVMTALQERGIPSRPYFTPIHLQPFYRERFGYCEGDFPITEASGRTCLALPFSSIMTEQQVDYVCQQLDAVLKDSSKAGCG